MKSFKKLLIIAPVIFCVVSCGTTENPSINEEKPDENSIPSKFGDIDFSKYNINIMDAKNIGIKQRNDVRSVRNSFKEEHKPERQNYLVKTTEENELEPINVTFSEFVNDTTEKEIEGEKDYIAFGGSMNEKHEPNNDAKIKISATEGFKYSLYYKKKLLLDSVKDNDENDLDKREGVIVFGNLKHNHTYTVKYKGVGKESVITPDEIEAEIDKFYVYSPDITLLSYVPIGHSKRPSKNEAETLPDGQTVYDSQGYFSNDDRQSFICNNKTGNIYKLGNDNNNRSIEINKIEYGLIYLNNSPFPYKLDFKKDDLVIVPLYTNKDLNCYHAFRDKYGASFVLNDLFDLYDEETDTYFFTTPRRLDDPDINQALQEQYMYYLGTKGESVRIPLYYFAPANLIKQFEYRSIQINTDEGFRDITALDSVKFIGRRTGELSAYSLENLELKIVSNDGGLFQYTMTNYFSAVCKIEDRNITKKEHSHLEYYKTGETNSLFLDNDILMFVDKGYEEKSNLYFIPDYFKNYGKSEPKLVDDNIYADKNTGKLFKRTINKNVFYQPKLIKKGNNEFEITLIEEGSDISPDDYTFQLRPINR